MDSRASNHAADGATGISRFVTSSLSRVLGLLLLAVAAWGAWDFPVGRSQLLLGLALYLLLLWREPRAWLIVVPAALPLLDLAFWSGRLFFTAFDMLVLATIGWGLLLARPWRQHMGNSALWFALVLALVQGWITARGLLPLSTPAPGAWTDYLASTNALREFKGVLGALLLWPLMAAERGRGTDLQRWLVAGMLAGLLAVLGTIVWERGLFTGLFNLSNPYRVSGWFSTLLTGGAAIDAFLALCAPFVVALFLLWDDWRLRLLGLALGLATLYGLYVTYSRANYPAMAVMLLVLAVGLWLSRPKDAAPLGRRTMVGLAIGALIGLAAFALAGKNIQARFQTTVADLDVRFAHWSSVVALLDQTPQGMWFGVGKGSFPREYYWQQQASQRHLALAVLRDEGADRFVRFSRSDAGGNLFLQQRLPAGRDGTYRLDITLRAPHGQAEALLIEFCERHILKFRPECRWRKIKVPAGTTDWQPFSVGVSLKGLGTPRFGPFGRPLDISLMNRGIQQGLDIGAVQLTDPEGNPLLGNSEFSDGWDHWFISYGDHLRWHIKNVFVYWLFEGGLVGLALMLALGVYVAHRLWRAASGGDPFAVLVASCLAACIMVGLFDSLFDEPRITLLFFVLVGASLISTPSDGVLAARQAFSNRRLPRGSLRLAGIAIAGTCLLLPLAYLIAPGAFLPWQIRALSWMEGNTPTLARWLKPADDLDARLAVLATLPSWQPRSMPPIPAGEIRINDEKMPSLRKALGRLRPGDQLHLGPGIYQEPLVIKANNVRISGHGHVVIERASAQGKAAIITNGDNIIIENIECRHITVSDRNGACVRHQGKHLTLDHVYFHSSEQGLLTGSEPGSVKILDSRFENLGMHGRAHGLYVGGGELTIRNSLILAAKSWGHEIKSRALRTHIERSVVASLGATDSRLLDLPNGGEVTVVNSVLEQGPQSSNEGAIGFGLEGRLHPHGSLRLTGNIVILERSGGNQLFQLPEDVVAPVMEGNVVISETNPEFGGDNVWLESRAAAGLPPYPALPEAPRD